MKRSMILSAIFMTTVLGFAVHNPTYNVRDYDGVELPSDPEFGPVIFPVAGQPNSYSLVYCTKTPEKTQIYYSCTEELDWGVVDDKEKNLHIQRFDNLEEEAVYRFNLDTTSEGVRKDVSMTTAPYGPQYRFSFGIADADSQTVLSADKNPHFIILLSQKTEFTGEEFESFYRRNRDVLSSTVILPMFDIRLKSETISLGAASVYTYRFRNANFIIFSQENNNYKKLYSLFSFADDDRNVLIFGNVSQDFIRGVVKEYAEWVDDIYTYRETTVPTAQWIKSLSVVDFRKQGRKSIERVSMITE